MTLANEVYRLTREFPKEEIFGLTSQMRRAAVSVPSNIAEGQGQLTDKSFILYLSRARGSLYELETQMELARQLEYLKDQELETFLSGCSELGRMLNGLLNSIREEKV